jgi:GT2 family glycosyltransferase
MESKKPLVTIIICTKNNKDIISDCLDSVKNQRYKNWHCLVVDDNSKDGTCELIERKYPFAKCFKLRGKGPSYNRNIGIKSSTGKYIVTLDSDLVLTQDWLLEMIKFMEENPQVGIGGGKILYQDDQNIINMAGGGLRKAGMAYHRGAGQNKNKKEYNQTIKTIYVCSASLVIRRDVLRTIGYFDSDYLYGYEDLDICWRANIAGFDVVYFPQAESYHQMGATIKKFPSEKMRFLANRNRVLTLLKNYETGSLVKYFPLFLVHFLYLLIFKDHRVATMKAYSWNIKNLNRTLNKRRKVNAIRKRNDKELFELF